MYGEEITVEIWEKLLEKSTSGGEFQSRIWNRYYHCHLHGEHIQYLRSYVCFTDIFILSANCNQDKEKKPLCDGICKSYSKAVATFIEDSTICPTTDSPSILQHRRNALQGERSCIGNSGNCLPGVQSDFVSCGFSGDVHVAASYCEKHETEECCSRIPSRVDHQPLQFFPDRVMKPYKPKKEKPLHVFSETYVKIYTIVGIILAMILCAMGSAYAVFKYKSNEPRPIYLRYPTDMNMSREKLHMLQ